MSLQMIPDTVKGWNRLPADKFTLQYTLLTWLKCKRRDSTSQVVPQSGLFAFTAKGIGSITGWGTDIPQAIQTLSGGAGAKPMTSGGQLLRNELPPLAQQKGRSWPRLVPTTLPVKLEERDYSWWRQADGLRRCFQVHATFWPLNHCFPNMDSGISAQKPMRQTELPPGNTCDAKAKGCFQIILCTKVKFKLL